MINKCAAETVKVHRQLYTFVVSRQNSKNPLTWLPLIMIFPAHIHLWFHCIEIRSCLLVILSIPDLRLLSYFTYVDTMCNIHIQEVPDYKPPKWYMDLVITHKSVMQLSQNIDHLHSSIL